MPNDAAQSILAPLQIDNSLKADAWEAFNSAQNESELQVKLMAMKDLPQSAKADLWEAKHAAAAPPANPVNQSLGQATGIGAQPSFWQKLKTAAGEGPSAVGGVLGDATVNPLLNSTAKVPGTGVTVGDATRNAQEFVQKAGGTALSLMGPGAGEGLLTKLPAARMAKAGQQIEAIVSQSKNLRVPVYEATSEAARAKELADAGNGTLPKGIGNFLKRVLNPDKPGITLDEVRDFYRGASKNTVDEFTSMKGPLLQQAKVFARTLGQNVEAALNAEKPGQGSLLRAAMDEYHDAATFGANVKKYGVPALKLAGGGFATSIGAGAGYEFLKKIGVLK